ncbi:hypothetical protein ASM33_00795 [Wolbachia endosymbiont of Folsomia candida]|nr:hypothetical protein ASM33_00795 [Wolbachia endosymbiont of Folsomia candida]
MKAIIDQIEKVLNLIQDEDLEKLGRLSGMDKYNTKLVGKMVFKGLISAASALTHSFLQSVGCSTFSIKTPAYSTQLC